MGNDMKLICDKVINGESVPCNITLATGPWLGQSIKMIAGVGNPFYVFATTPVGQPVAVDYSAAAICSVDNDENEDAANAMIANPPAAGLVIWPS